MNNGQDVLKFKYDLLCQFDKKASFLVKKGLMFIAESSWKQYRSSNEYKEVFVTGAKYLHRGYYCPSPVRHIIIRNSRRGKVLMYPTNRSKISHKYYFDQNGKLMIVKATLPNGREKTEYLQYEGNIIYGFAFDDWGTLVGLSEEQYESGLIRQYYCVSCYINPKEYIDLGITEVQYEAYSYKEEGLLDVEFYFTPGWIGLTDKRDEIDAIVRGNQYSCVCKIEDGSPSWQTR